MAVDPTGSNPPPIATHLSSPALDTMAVDLHLQADATGFKGMTTHGPLKMKPAEERFYHQVNVVSVSRLYRRSGSTTR
jgi:hypothetical protein